MGYSIDTPGYRIWDPTTHKVWEVRTPDFDESVQGGWWRKQPAVDRPAWGEDEPLHFDYMEEPVVVPPVEQPGAIVPVPPAVADEDEEQPGDDAPYRGGGGLLDDVNEDDDDDPPAIDGVAALGPRMS